MSVEIKVPVLGESVVSATVTRWFKQPGETVARDEPVVELETDKISVEVPAPCGGILKNIAAAEGDDVQVGALLGTMDGQDSLNLSPKPAAAPASIPPTSASSAPDAPASAASPKTAPPLPAAAKLMQEHALKPEDIKTASGRDGRLTKADVVNHLETITVDAALPSSRPPATQQTAPIPQAAAMRPAQQRSVPTRDQSAPSRALDPAREERVPMSRLRQTIARRLKDAQNTAAILTTFNEIDMSAARAIRDNYRASFEKKHGVRLGYMSFFARAVIEALQDCPALNAEIIGTDIIYRRQVNLGIAVGSSRGLVVPVIRDAGTMGFADMERRISDYGKRARDGALKLEELAEGTFSITNGGVFGSLLSTPILNTPQSGILGMHAIQDRPVAVDGRVEIRPMMYVALSYDHRIVDGREAVSFLVRIKQLIEDPHRLLLDI